MLDEISSFLSILYYLLLIFLIIVILIFIFYPDFSFSRYFYGDVDKDDHNSNEDHDNEESMMENDNNKNTDKTDISQVQAPMEYKKYNQKFKVQNIDDIDGTLKEDTIEYNDLIELIKDQSFIKGYTESVTTTYNDKLLSYQEKLNKTNEKLKSYKDKIKPGNNNYDSNLDMWVLEQKEYINIIDCINKRLKTLTQRSVTKRLHNIFYNKKYGFASIVGRDNIKNLLAQQIYTFYRNPKVFKIQFPHIVLVGNSGVGKTKLSLSMSYIYSKSYILARDGYNEYSPKDFGSQFVNESKRLTYKILLNSLERVANVDEAYGITGTGYSLLHNHNDDIITEIVNFTDKHIGEHILIFSGYEREMSEMFSTNQGLERRFPHLIKISDYTTNQLTDILIGSIQNTDEDLILDETDKNTIYTYIELLCEKYKDVFNKQAADMIKLSEHILKSIYTSKSYVWTSGRENFKIRASLLLSGFNSYLKSKNLAIVV